MRILIAGSSYAPEETGIAPYTTGFAEHLVERGHDVTVITGMPSYPSGRSIPSTAVLFASLRRGAASRSAAYAGIYLEGSRHGSGVSLRRASCSGGSPRLECPDPMSS
jgi:hypothetical protein